MKEDQAIGSQALLGLATAGMTLVGGIEAHVIGGLALGTGQLVVVILHRFVVLALLFLPFACSIYRAVADHR